jgi:excinuclease ABC subunit C
VDFPGPSAASRATAARLPLGSGVYRFRDAAGPVLYVGRAACLRRRVAFYWGDLGDRGHLAAMVARITMVRPFPAWDLANLALWTALGAGFVAWRFRWQT